MTPTKARIPSECVGPELEIADTLTTISDIAGDESFWDRFICYAGGHRCDEELTFQSHTRNADYIFTDHNAVCELKTIQTDANESEGFAERILYALSRPSRALRKANLRNEVNLAFAKRVEKVIKSANQQLRQTISITNDPDYFGVVILVNLGMGEVKTTDADTIIRTILRNRTRFSSVHGVIYIPKRLAMINGRESLPIGWIIGPHAHERSIRFGGAFMNSLIDFAYG